MKDIPEGEARELLAVPSDCLGLEEWHATVRAGNIFVAECGLLHDGVYAQLAVHLQYSYRQDIKVTHMKFTVFRKTVHGQDRVCQLDINDNPKAGKNAHNLPHMHWGDNKYYDHSMVNWKFQDAIEFFSRETKINFEPPLFIPGFTLK